MAPGFRLTKSAFQSQPMSVCVKPHVGVLFGTEVLPEGILQDFFSAHVLVSIKFRNLHHRLPVTTNRMLPSFIQIPPVSGLTGREEDLGS